jgi:hypothetical protein
MELAVVSMDPSGIRHASCMNQVPPRQPVHVHVRSRVLMLVSIYTCMSQNIEVYPQSDRSIHSCIASYSWSTGSNALTKDIFDT